MKLLKRNTKIRMKSLQVLTVLGLAYKEELKSTVVSLQGLRELMRRALPGNAQQRLHEDFLLPSPSLIYPKTTNTT